jgi:N-acetylmuramoyl-L-alanine amidase
MAWLKLTGKALYLMKSSSDRFIDSSSASSSFGSEDELRVSIPLQWFNGRDVPGTLIVNLTSDEPLPVDDSENRQSNQSLNGQVIVLDPGHGEVEAGVNDPGAVNRGLGRTERDEVRKQADLIKAELESKGASVKIVENNTGKSLGQIGSEGAGSNCFISLHLNAFNGDAHGHEVLIDTDGTAKNERLAGLINEELDRQLDIRNRGVKRQGLGVLRGVPRSVPAVLVESFFIDSVRDAGTLDRLIGVSAKAIATGIERFLVG